MNCYICEQGPRPITMRYGIMAAIGICRDCGIGVCTEHSHKGPEPGAPLLCQSCAARRARHPISQRAEIAPERTA